MNNLKIRPIGNSLGVVLPKEILAQMNVDNGDVLYVSKSPDGTVRLTPFDPAFEEQMKAAEDGMKAYRNTLRELSK